MSYCNQSYVIRSGLLNYTMIISAKRSFCVTGHDNTHGFVGLQGYISSCYVLVLRAGRSCQLRFVLAVIIALYEVVHPACSVQLAYVAVHKIYGKRA